MFTVYLLPTSLKCLALKCLMFISATYITQVGIIVGGQGKKMQYYCRTKRTLRRQKWHTFAQQLLRIQKKHKYCSDEQKASDGRSTTHASNLFHSQMVKGSKPPGNASYQVTLSSVCYMVNRLDHVSTQNCDTSTGLVSFVYVLSPAAWACVMSSLSPPLSL